MIQDLNSRLGKLFKKHRKLVLILAGTIVLLAITASIAYSRFNHAQVTADTNKTYSPVAIGQTQTPATKSAAKKAIDKEPPKYATNGNSSTVENTDGSRTTTVSEGAVNPENQSKAAAAGSSGSSPMAIHYIDETGQYPNLGSELESYLSSLLWKGEVSSLNAIIVEDAGDTGWAGLYSGSYTEDQSGRINSAWGYITLNTYYYQSSPYFVDYMKLVLSHEYGHHYTLYHKWMDWQLTADTRFPDSYYNIRPLPKGSTAPDYSLGWGNCDAEIIAEDYSYLYSGYGVDAMAGTYGYPSAATKTWLVNEPSGSSEASVPEAATPAPQSSPVPSPTPVATATPAASVAASVVAASPVADTQNPIVTITAPASNPYSWASGNLTVSATATDNVAVSKIELYVNDQLVATQTGATISRTWMQNGTPTGIYTLKAKAYDTSNNTAETSITVNKTF